MPRAAAPAPVTVVGRERERALVAAALRDPSRPLVVVHGPSGMGASALVDQVWQSMGGAGTAGPRTVDVDGVVALDDLLGLLDRTLRADGPLPADGLVVLDRADDAGPAIARLSGRLPPGMRLLACSIRSLPVPDARQVRLGPLPVPGADEVGRDNPAVRLFLDSAGLEVDGGQVDDDDLLAAAVICRLAGGWPLVIRTVAAWTGALRPAVLADRLGAQPDLVFRPTPDPRSPAVLLPSVRAALDRTWRWLSADERAVLRAGCLFRGTAGVPDLARVSGLDPGAALDAIAGLVGLSLLEPAERGRFRVTGVVGAFARGRFDRTLSERTARRRYLDVVCDNASQISELFDAGDDPAAMFALGDLAPECLPALDLLCAVGDTGRALRLAGDVAPGLTQAGTFEAAAGGIDALLRRADLPASAAHGSALVGYADLVLSGVGGVDVRELAFRRLSRGVDLVREWGEPHARLRALAVVCNAWPVTQDLSFSAPCVTEGLTLARQVGSAPWLARFEAWSGMLAHQTGDLDGAARLGAQALARARRCGDGRARLLAGILLQTLPTPPSDLPGGIPSPEDLLEVAAGLTEPRLQSIVLAILADRALASGRADITAYRCAQALELVGSLDTWYGAGFAVMYLVAVAADRGEPEQAARLHGMVLDRLDVLTANMPPHVSRRYRQLVTAVRAASDVDSFDRAARSSAVLPWREAAATALQYAYLAGGGGSGPTGHVAIGPPRGAGRRSVAGGPTADLTPREAQVLSLIAQGQDSRSIAERLRMSVHSVSHHTSNVLRKLGVSNRTQAAIWAARHSDALHGVLSSDALVDAAGRGSAGSASRSAAGRSR